MPVVTDFWAPYRRAVEYAEQLAMNAIDDGKGLVVELGPGNRPFSLATDFVGRDPTQSRNGYAGTFHQINLSNEELPWDDDEVSFLYARHTIEDLDDPDWCLSEIQRVAKAGYIETPSPIVECCKGVDAELAKNGKRPPWRGYNHHRSICWDSAGEFSVVGKFPMLEYIDLGAGEETLADLLNTGPLHWNTYFAWTGKLRYRIYRHEVDFEVGHGYGELLDKAMTESQESARRLP